MSITTQISSDLLISESDIASIINSSGRLYRKFQIPKRNKSMRTIYSPSKEAKLIQYWLIKKVFSLYPLSSHSFAYIEGRNIFKNALYHSDNDFFWKLDFDNFFEAITFDNLSNFIRTNQLQVFANIDSTNEELLDLIKRFCFLPSGKMAQGFCSSPLISNILMFEFDKMIFDSLPREFSDASVRYSRYADDIVISFKKDTIKQEILDHIKSKVREFKAVNLTINGSKTKFGKKCSGSSYVNGLKICNDGRITVHRSYKDKIKAMLHKYTTLVTDDGFKRKLLGHIFYIRSVDSRLYNRLSSKYYNQIETLKEQLSDNF